jgi:hypothetical protein
MLCPACEFRPFGIREMAFLSHEKAKTGDEKTHAAF